MSLKQALKSNEQFLKTLSPTVTAQGGARLNQSLQSPDLGNDSRAFGSRTMSLNAMEQNALGSQTKADQLRQVFRDSYVASPGVARGSRVLSNDMFESKKSLQRDDSGSLERSPGHRIRENKIYCTRDDQAYYSSNKVLKNLDDSIDAMRKTTSFATT